MYLYNLYRKVQLQLSIIIFAIYFFKMHGKTGIDLLFVVPQCVKMALKED